MLQTALSTALGGAGMSTPRSFVLGKVQVNLGLLIKQIFKAGEQGFAYDPNDLSTLYQDAAGTTPVTGAGQPVGLFLDKSKGLALGGEKKGTATTQLIGSATAATYNTSTGEATCARVDFSNQSFIRIGGLTGLHHKVAITNTGTTPVSVRAGLNSGDQIILNVNAGQSATFFIVPVGGAVTVTSVSGSASFTINYVKELSGNHAYQTTSASRPILRQTPILGNELVVNGDFNDGISNWGVVGSSTTKGITWSSGTLKVSAETTGTCVSSGLMSSQLVVGKQYQVSGECVVYDAIGGLNSIYVGDGGQLVGTVTKAGKFSFVFTASTAFTKINIGRISGGVASLASSQWDNVSVKEILSYRTDQNYLEFDGTDDFLVTNSIDFTSTDKVSLFAGVRKLGDTTAALAELSVDSNTTTGNFLISAPNASATYAVRFKGTSGGASALTGYLPPHSAVLFAKGSIANKLQVLRVNGVSNANQFIDMGTGNYGNYPLYIGRRGGTTSPFNGHLYSLIGIGRLTTDSETTSLEKSIAKNVGVTL